MSGYLLVFTCHEHEVKELVHARLAEPHDGGVCEALKDLSDGLHRVELLGGKDLCDVLGVEHGPDDIVEDLAALISGNALGLEPLVEDVEHLAPCMDGWGVSRWRMIRRRLMDSPEVNHDLWHTYQGHLDKNDAIGTCLNLSFFCKGQRNRKAPQI